MQADQMYLAGDYASACAIISKAHAISPDWIAKNHWAYYLLAQKEYAQAIKFLEEALALRPEQDPLAIQNCRGIIKDAAMIMHLRARMTGPSAPAFRTDHATPRDPWENDAIAAIADQLPDGAPGQMSIVFFHVDRSGEHPFLSTSDAIDYHSTLAAACNAARRASPDARVIVLSDKSSNLSMVPDGVNVVRVDAAASEMMFSRLRSYRALAMSARLRGPILFLDTDVCLNRDFAPLMDGSFDMGLTFRRNFWHMPLNEGVIIALNAERAAAFFDMDLDLYEWIASHPFVAERYGFDIKMWRGGQLSLGALIDWNFPPAAPADLVVGGVRCHMLPCDDFNYNVKITDDPSTFATKWAVHFKGAQTKKLMTL